MGCINGFGLPATVLTMFTGKPQKNRSAATTYFDQHLSHNDYYAQDATHSQQAGQWIGVGAQKLGLNTGQPVTREVFLRLCDNLHPETTERLTQVTAKERRIFFDFQCAPPKPGSGRPASRSAALINARAFPILYALSDASDPSVQRQLARLGGVEG